MTRIVQLKQLKHASFYSGTFAIQTDNLLHGRLLDRPSPAQYYIDGIIDSFVLEFEY